MDWDTMGLRHTGIGTHWDCDTQGLVHVGTGTHSDWDTLGLRHTGTVSFYSVDDHSDSKEKEGLSQLVGQIFSRA